MSSRLIILIIIALLAFTTRLLPVSISEYPFNNDAVNESRISSDILASGHLTYPEGSYYLDSQSIITPTYNLVLAFFASVVGATPYEVAQLSVAVIAVLLVVSFYILANSIVGCRKSAVAGTLVVALFGTFVFMTGSAWKESIGAALYVFLMLAYVRRQETRMLVLEVILLLILPSIHHLIAVVAYLSLAYLTGWSVIVAMLRHTLTKRHLIDMTIIGGFSLIAYSYYRMNTFESLDYIDAENGLLLMALSFLSIFIFSTLVFLMKRHSRYTFAPVPAIAVLGLLTWNHYSPIFPYVQGEHDYVLILGIATCVLIGIGWYGLEKIIETTSRYRMIPLGLLLPVITLFLFAFSTGLDLSSHKILYRTYDLADISLAFGVAIGVAAMSRFPRRQMIMVISIIVALLISFPFAYATGYLIGVRHDTQGYEVDAIDWIHDTGGVSPVFQSDERLAYDARVLWDLEKNAGLPSVFTEERLPRNNSFNALLEEWITDGVSDYPYGYREFNSTYIADVLKSSDVLYVGGPSYDNIIIFRVSAINYELFYDG